LYDSDDGPFAFLAQLWKQLRDAPADVAGLELLLAQLASPHNPDVPLDNYPSAHFANLCGDVAWSRSLERYRSHAAADGALSPLFGDVASNIHPCAFWPVSPIEPIVPIVSASRGPANILIMQNLRDPATPHLGAVRMHAALGQRSRM